jgi:hypothetical protein
MGLLLFIYRFRLLKLPAESKEYYEKREKLMQVIAIYISGFISIFVISFSWLFILGLFDLL